MTPPRLLAAALAALLLPACGGDDSADPRPDASLGRDIPDDLDANLATWKAQLRKDCSVFSAFGHPEWDPEHDPAPQLDAALVLEKLGGRLVAADGADTVIFGQPLRPSRSGFSNRRIELERDGRRQQVEVGAEASFDGLCTITLDGVEVYRGQLWGEVPVAAHVKATMPTPREGPTVLYGDASAARGAAYLEMQPLEVVATALAGNQERATEILAARLGVPAADLADHVIPGWGGFESVTADAATAAFPVFAALSAGPLVRLRYYIDPIVPVDVASLTSWVPATETTRTLRVRVPRPALSVPGYLESPERPAEVAVRVVLTNLGAGDVRVSVADAAVTLATDGGPAAAAACVRQQAQTTLAYLRVPQRVPLALLSSRQGAAAMPWVTLPCSVLTADLPAAIRADNLAMTLVADLIDPRSYRALINSTRVQPRGWDELLAGYATDPASYTALARSLGPNPVTGRGVTAGSLAVQLPAYLAMPADEQRLRRQLVWHASMTCGDLDAATVAQLVALSSEDVKEILDDDLCPLR